MNVKTYSKMIKLHSDSNKFNDTINNDNNFSPFTIIYNKTLLEIAVIHNNFDAYKLLIKHSKFKSLMSKSETRRYFLSHIAERISECEWEKNKRYLYALFDIDYIFTTYDLIYFKSNYNIFMEIFNRMNNIDYKGLLKIIEVYNENIKLELLEIIIKYCKNNNILLTIVDFESCILNCLDKGNATCLEIISENGYNISMIKSRPIISYILNHNYRYNDFLINYLLYQKWYYNLNLFDYIQPSQNYYNIDKLLIIKKNHNKLKIQFKTFKDTDNLHFISIVMNSLTNFNSYTNTSLSPKNLLKVINSFYYLLQIAEENNVTNMIESLPKKFYNKSIEIYNIQPNNYTDQIKYYLKDFMKIMIVSKQTQTEDFKNLLKLVFTENELEQILQVS